MWCHEKNQHSTVIILSNNQINSLLLKFPMEGGAMSSHFWFILAFSISVSIHWLLCRHPGGWNAFWICLYSQCPPFIMVANALLCCKGICALLLHSWAAQVHSLYLSLNTEHTHSAPWPRPGAPSTLRLGRCEGVFCNPLLLGWLCTVLAWPDRHLCPGNQYCSR